jgi:NAD(P)-dependent dehydrogenase (short-subunit alcohol dehydrogenase family)
MVLAGGALAAAAAAVSAPAEAQRPPSARSRFRDRVVLITGATSGIGEATARAFAREGAKVAFNGRRAELGRQVQDSINADPATRSAGGESFYVRSDVRKEEQVERFVQAAMRRFGAVHIAFNNAGVVFGNGKISGAGPVADIMAADFDDVWATNTRGVFLSMKHEIPAMLRNEPWGRYGLRGVIVNNASVSAHGGFNGISPYSTSKHAVLGLTRCAALDYGARGIRTNSISPGGVTTPMRSQSIRAQRNDPEANPAPNIQYRTNTVEEMADVVLFLAEADAPSAIMGTDIDVTMGMVTGPLTPPRPSA